MFQNLWRSQMPKIGDRVGAICSAKDDTIELFGYGVYAGEGIPGSDVTFLGESYEDVMNKRGITGTNPLIKLDDGDIVWGCECWWASEERIRKEVAKYKKAVIISIHEYREKGQKLRNS